MKVQYRLRASDPLLRRAQYRYFARVETLIRDMDEAGVDKTIALPSSSSMASGEEPPKISLWRVNEYVAEAQNRYPDRIIGFARVDTPRKDAVDVLVKAVKDWGLNRPGRMAVVFGQGWYRIEDPELGTAT